MNHPNNKISPLKLVPAGMEEEINLHIRKTREQMAVSGIDALLVASNVNLYYLTGRFFRGYIYLPLEGSPVYFVVKPQIYEAAENMHYVRKPEQIPEVLTEIGLEMPSSIGLETDVLTYSEILRLKKLFPEAEICNGTAPLRNARMIKTDYEIGQMRIDGVHQVRAYCKITSLYREGMTDLQLQIEIERILRLEGCLGFARVAGSLMNINMGSVLAGDNADNPSPYEFAMGGEGVDTSLPGGANGTLIRKGETVMIDMNGSFNAYQTDMTRVWSRGNLPDLAYQAHDCSRKILRELENFTRPGVALADLYIKAEELAREDGLADFFMGHRQKAGFIGHGVGIELNEQPPVTGRSKVIVQENMALALEPKFVLPGIGAVGVENTYIVRPDAMECLTEFKEEILPLY